MKTKFFVFLLAFVATLPFASCSDDDLSDDELASKILSYASYEGVDSDGDRNAIAFKQSTYVLQYYDEKDTRWYTSSEGTWKVSGGNLVLTDSEDGSSFTVSISDEGKKLSVVDGEYTLVFQVAKK